MEDITSDPKLQVILASAWKAFATYGFRKTSMDDIAKGAGISRPALYLHYRNKEDIFRRLVQMLYDDSTKAVSAALAGPGTVAEILATAFAAQAGEVIEAMLASPHGLELMDVGSVNALDIIEAGEARLKTIYAGWLTDQAAAGRVQLTGPADEVAATFCVALKGLKMGGSDFATYTGRVAQLAAMIGAGLSAR
ncbi:MAG: AcrR family transcriptional regulator [Paracoccaceae bacterium]|jgi:AcrR family transcriptional regulator